MTDLIERMKEALGEYEKALSKYGNPLAKDVLAIKARTLLPEAMKEVEELRGKLAEMQSGQPYTYYGRDGKPVLARDLEDRAEAAEAKLAVAVEASYREGFRDGGWVFGSDHEDKSWIDSNASAALAEIKGEKP